MADIGLIGLAVMGQNLVLNMNDHGYSVVVYNRTQQKTDDFLQGPAAGRETVIGASSIEELVAKLDRPRRVMLMVKAGEVVDRFIEQVLPHLDEGDIIIDGGNSHFADSERRTRQLAEKGINFVGTGVSGGEEGARRGPSIMPGGSPEAWPHVSAILQDISAKTPTGEACCAWVGSGGAGHFVKMVHNGIEYGDMQLISEAYHLMSQVLGMSPAEMHTVFAAWNEGPLDSYLIEITRDILAYEEEGEPLVDKILDTAGQKGTGKWTGVESLHLGMPVTLIAESVFARCLSALKDERVEASAVLTSKSAAETTPDRDSLLADLEQALLLAKIVSYAQGFMLLREASREHGWTIDYGSVALMWREGCIIRSVFLENIKAAFDRAPNLKNLLLDSYFAEIANRAEGALRRVAGAAIAAGVPAPVLTAALAYYDGYRSPRLPANLLQAQRDYFGAHTYERVDRPRGEFFHTNWTGTGGDVSSSTYEV